jgi:F-type H+-transporting ATPase subunit b
VEVFVGQFESFIGVNFWTALFTLLNFLLVFFVGKKFLWGPVTKIITDRQKEIDDLYADANTAKSSAEALEAEYQQKLAVATETGDRIVKEAVARGQAREEEILRQANADASAIMAKASADIALEKKKALNDAKNEISDIAMAIAEKVVGRELNGADHADLVNGFIDRLGERA